MYDLEFYIYGIIPMIVGILIMWKSIQTSLKRKMVVSWFITFIIAVSFALAEYMLFLIRFTEAWPTYLPHILLALNAIMLSIQLLLKNRKY
jgi:hypothetical protein